MKHVRCIDCAREMLRSEVECNYQHIDGSWLYTCIDRSTCMANITAPVSHTLDVAFCPGCGKAWTRAEMAKLLWDGFKAVPRRYAFSCDACGWEFGGGCSRRPLTLAEIMAGKRTADKDAEDLQASLVRYLVDYDS